MKALQYLIETDAKLIIPSVKKTADEVHYLNDAQFTQEPLAQNHNVAETVSDIYYNEKVFVYRQDEYLLNQAKGSFTIEKGQKEINADNGIMYLNSKFFTKGADGQANAITRRIKLIIPSM